MAQPTETEQRFRLLVESVKDYAIFMLDAAGHVSSWNAGAERIKGYTASEIIGKHFSTFYPPEVAATGKCEFELEVAGREGRFQEEGWRLRKDGSRLWASVTITALRNPEGALIGFAKVTQDLTERKQAEENHRLLAAQSAALEEKTRIQKFQERFLAILGHDLRNPLAALEMGAGILRQRTADPASIRVLDRMHASSRRMSRMIEQILDLTRSRLGGGLQLARAPMDLRDALVAMVDEVRGAHPFRTIVLECPSLRGNWDRDRLEQVFSNLVGNAVLHGDPGKPVSVSARAEGQFAMVEVHNEGPPISPELQASLFDPFRRGVRDSRTANTDGLGLGLFISREVILAHGGAIEASSDAIQGTTFRVTIPLSLTAPPGPEREKTP